MAQVIRPQVQNNEGFSKLLTLGGAIAGGAAGGPGGAMAGAGAGQMAGGFFSPQAAQAPSIPGGGESAAMARRQAQMAQDNLATLKQAEAALPQLPEQIRQQYAPAIVQARLMEQKQRGIG